jgi:LysM repeat protein
MQARALGNALAVALISIVLVLGALSISLVEFAPQAIPAVTHQSPFSTLPVAPAATYQSLITETASGQTLPIITPTETITSTPTITATVPSTCAIPAGWGQVQVQTYDTLENIAARYRIDPFQLRDMNCLPGNSLLPGSILYVPPVATNTAVICNQGMNGWTKNYTVRRGDTFYSISRSYSTNAALMKNVNCRSSDTIYPGEVLWVPIVVATLTPMPSSTPIPGDTVIPYPTDPLTETPLPYTVTPVPSPTPVPNTPTPIPTWTASPTAFQP